MLKYAKLSRYKIRKISRCFCIDIEASKTAELLTINRNTINRYYRLFRLCIYRFQTEQQRQFIGHVEVDESYFGARRPRGVTGPLKRGRGTLKQPVFGVFERHGRVYTEIVPDCSKATLQGIICGKVSLETVIHSDSWPGYNGLVDVGFDKHLRVNHSKEFSRGKGCHINGIESFWSFTKRRFNHFNGIHKRWFDLHLKECEWRWNRTTEELEEHLWQLFKQLGPELLSAPNMRELNNLSLDKGH
jgi:transposase-like protein